MTIAMAMAMAMAMCCSNCKQCPRVNMDELNSWGGLKWQGSNLCVTCHTKQDHDDIDDDESPDVKFYNRGGINASPVWLLRANFGDMRAGQKGASQIEKIIHSEQMNVSSNFCKNDL